MSDKYPRTLHVPWSPGASDDDKILDSVDHLLNRQLIVTEKVDGGNCCLTRDAVFARTHGAIPSHPSFSQVKAQWATIRYDIPEKWSIFGENAYAKHSIAYNALPAYFLVFGIRGDETGEWFAWWNVWSYAQSLGLETVPVLFEGKVSSEKELRALGEDLIKKGSQCGGDAIEGYVIRVASEFIDFEKSVAKFVRANHVTTDAHWDKQPIIPNLLRT